MRTPSRVDRELQAPGIVLPALDFATEKLIAYEIGYRGRPTSNTSLSVSFYYDSYSDLRSTNVISLSPLLFQLSNSREGSVYGVEAWGDWQVLRWWRLSAGVNLLRKNLRLKAGVISAGDNQSVGDDPGYQLSWRSSFDLPHDIKLDIGFRAVDGLPTGPIPSYVEAEARIAWQVAPNLELSLAGYNLLAPRHVEIANPPMPLQAARRSIYLGLRRTF
ncbi:MAG: TonB-dependent receptor [Acetobacteraceae bacterium]